jgi:hypothetical protein
LYNALSGYPILLRKQVGLIIFYAFRVYSNVVEAAYCYRQAAELFEEARMWSSAAKPFLEAASLYLKAGSKHVAATNFERAAYCYTKCDDFNDGEICCWLLLLC